MTHSALYEGTVRHRRRAERRHELVHRVALAYLDLDELAGLVDGRLVRRRPGFLRFRRSDYLGDPAVPLAQAVRHVVADRLGDDPGGPVRLLTHVRSFGHCFNPVSFYYCFSRASERDRASGDERLVAIVAEVTNTPWGERHTYVLPCELTHPSGGGVLTGSFPKRLHVSPFMGMDQRYTWVARPPGPTLWLHLASVEGGEPVFDATLRLRRRPLDRRGLASVAARYPAATVRVLALIYAHALALWLKGVRIRPHPGAQQ